MAKSYAGVVRTFSEIVFEVRKKLVLVVGILVAGSVIGYLNMPFVMNYLTNMLGDIPLIYIAPAEGFTSQLKMAVTIGIIMALPFVLYIIVNYIKSRSKKLQIKHVTRIIAIAYGLFLTGVAFSVLVILPASIRFLMSYSTENLFATMAVGSYFSFVSMITLVFGFTFELPMLLSMLTGAGVLKSSQLKAKRKYVVLIMFIVAAILTPPDVVSQVLLAIPLMILYEISIFIADRREKSLNKKKMAASDPTNINSLTAEEWETQRKAHLERLGLDEKTMAELEKPFSGG